MGIFFVKNLKIIITKIFLFVEAPCACGADEKYYSKNASLMRKKNY